MPPRGFNLLEMILASMVFTTIMVALLSIWSHNARTLHRDQNRIMAASIAENIMEAQLSLGFKADDIPATDFDVTHFVDGAPSTVKFQYEVKVKDTSTGPESVALKECLVRVSWEEEDGPKQIQLQALLSWQS